MSGTGTSTASTAPQAITAAGPIARAAWEAFVTAGTLRASTRNVYRQTALRFLHWLEPQGIGLVEVTAPDVDRFLEALDITTASRSLYRAALRRFFDALTAREVMAVNPADDAKPGKAEALSEPVPVGADGAEPPPTLDELKSMVRELDPGAIDDNPEMLDAGVVLLAGACLGTGKIAPICRFTRVHPRPVAKFAQRLRANSVWTAEAGDDPDTRRLYVTEGDQ
jgi:hypothetical protein